MAGLLALAVSLGGADVALADEAAPAPASRAEHRSAAIWSVLFDHDRARVKRAGREVLEAVVELWKRNPDWKRLIIEGHSDASGPEHNNQRMSEQRAERVRLVLIELGADPDRLEVVGYGSRRPLVRGSSDSARQANRRVEFVIVR